MNLYVLLSVLLLCLCLLVYVYIKFLRNRSKLNEEISRADSLKSEVSELSSLNENIKLENIELRKNNEKLSERNQSLEFYASILETEEQAKEHLEKSYIDAENIINDANSKAILIKNEATNEAESLIGEAKSILNDANNNADAIKNKALIKASNIISEAESKARDISESAYNIKNDYEHYENILKAIKNAIHGYGDEYIKPTYSILDDLAEEFGYDQAGVKLKEARYRTKMLMGNREAATCDYVETYRRDTAINFVTDAFNGKVDSIVSMIKRDNYGILEQKIKDAYILVNNLGKAFRNARVTEEYLNSRLEELKWGVIVNELKIKEREEQRRIKEQMREEEKAKREYERAMKEAAKEEEMIRKAMEKAKISIEKATEEQKSKYEEQLSMLQEKLKEAEEKNKRALSMAQQTKSGHVYIISNIGSFGENIFKIGMTRRLDPIDRVKELGDASVPFPFDVHAMIYSDNAPELETELHKFFVENQVNKVNPRKEFFRVPLSEIRKEISRRNIDAKWTITALATEYRETLSIEKSMSENERAKYDWIKEQESIQEIE